MDPLRRLHFDLETDRLSETGEEIELNDDAITAANLQAKALLAQHGIRVPAKEALSTEPATPVSREYSVHFEPIATLAAADLVKATVPWEAGTIRFLQSSMRADLAIEVVIDEGRTEEFDGTALFILLKNGTDPIAVLPDASPVFTGLFADDFANGIEARLTCVTVPELTSDQLDSLKRSQRNLRDPGSLAQYKSLIARAEQGE